MRVWSSVLSVSLVGVAAVACVDNDDAAVGNNVPDACAIRAGATQALSTRFAPRVTWILAEDAGGPRRCDPAADRACGPCAGDAIFLPVGVQSTVVLTMDNVGQLPLTLLSATVSANAAGEVVVLAPTPAQVPRDERADVFIGITPTTTAPVSATITLDTDAGNDDVGEAVGYDVTLTYVGTSDDAGNVDSGG